MHELPASSDINDDVLNSYFRVRGYIISDVKKLLDITSSSGDIKRRSVNISSCIADATNAPVQKPIDRTQDSHCYSRIKYITTL